MVSRVWFWKKLLTSNKRNYVIDPSNGHVYLFSKQSKQSHWFSFFETPRVGNIGILVLLKFKNELEVDTSDISFNSVGSWQINICIQIHLVDNYFQFISIWSNTKMPIVQTSGDSKK